MRIFEDLVDLVNLVCSHCSHFGQWHLVGLCICRLCTSDHGQSLCSVLCCVSSCCRSLVIAQFARVADVGQMESGRSVALAFSWQSAATPVSHSSQEMALHQLSK